MFYKTITGDRFITAIIIFLIALFIWVPAFLSPEIIEEQGKENFMPFYSFISSQLEGHVLFSKILSFFIMLLEAFMLIRINAKFVLIQQRTFLPALFFIIIAGTSPGLQQWNSLLPASFFVIVLLDIIFRSYGDEPNSYRFFEAGIVLGIGGLFYAPVVYLFVFIWFASMVQRPFKWREYLFPIIGLFVPFLFYFVYLFFTNNSIPDFLTRLRSNFIFKFEIPEYHMINLIFAAYIALLLAISSVYLLKVFQFRKIYIRDYFMVLFWLFITGSVMFFLFSGFNTGITYLIGISMSYLLTNYFKNARISIGNKVLLYTLLVYTLFLALNNYSGIL